MKIVVLAGGISPERDVSLSTGRMIYRALKEKGHQAIFLDSFLGCGEDEADSAFESSRDWSARVEGVKEASPDLDEIKALRPGWEQDFFGPNVIKLCRRADVVFLALHGGDGENGRIQAYFDLAGITYTGTDYVSSALAMDKSLTKELFLQNGICTPLGEHLRKGQEDTLDIPFPRIVKACKGGSSVGVSIAMDEKDYEAAKAEAFLYDDEVVVEQYIRGREFSVGVLDGKALPVIEMAPAEGFYDYKNKYQAGSTVETCPACISGEKTAEMQAVAEKVFRCLRLKSYARMDYIMENGTQKVYCLEANTLPGMTPVSLLPQEAAAAGMSFGELCERIIGLALEGEKKL